MRSLLLTPVWSESVSIISDRLGRRIQVAVLCHSKSDGHIWAIRCVLCSTSLPSSNGPGGQTKVSESFQIITRVWGRHWDRNTKSTYKKCYVGFCTPRRTEMDPRTKKGIVDMRVWVLLITQIPYIVRVPGKGRNGCILQPKPSNCTLSQLYECRLQYSRTRVQLWGENAFMHILVGVVWGSECLVPYGRGVCWKWGLYWCLCHRGSGQYLQVNLKSSCKGFDAFKDIDLAEHHCFLSRTWRSGRGRCYDIAT